MISQETCQVLAGIIGGQFLFATWLFKIILIFILVRMVLPYTDGLARKIFPGIFKKSRRKRWLS